MTRTVTQLFDLHGKTALITGGSRGLGFQMAQALGEAGARVMLTARKSDELAHAAARLQQAGIQVSWLAADGSFLVWLQPHKATGRTPPGTPAG